MTRLLLDTNVWLDYLMGFRRGSKEALALVNGAIERDVPLLYAAASAKDLYCLVGLDCKRACRQRTAGGLTEAQSQAADEMAWASLDCLFNLATAVGVEQSDLWLARKLRATHNDFEDDLVVAAAMRAEALLVTSDATLLRHCPVAALDVHDTIAYLAAENSSA